MVTQHSELGYGIHQGFYHLEAQIEIKKQRKGEFPSIEIDGGPFRLKSCSLRESSPEGFAVANYYAHWSTDRPTTFLVWTPPGTAEKTLTISLTSLEPRAIRRVTFEKPERPPSQFQPVESHRILQIQTINGKPQRSATATQLPKTDSPRSSQP